jgi:hypothetical protein
MSRPKEISKEISEQMRSKLYQLRAILIDEVSMISSSLFETAHLRMQQIFQNKITFGGVSVILFGDLYQLKPVRNQFIFEPNKLNTYAQFAGSILWQQFKYYQLTECMRQKDDLQFAKILHNLAYGEKINIQAWYRYTEWKKNSN